MTNDKWFNEMDGEQALPFFGCDNRAIRAKR
jgi:hypothetical protein